MHRYHLQRSDREIRDLAVIESLLSGGKLATVSMCRGGEPYCVTMDYGYDRSARALYFHCANKGLKLDFISANPEVCVSIVNDLGYVEGKCEHKYRSLIMRGIMRRVEGKEEKRQGLRVLIEHQEKDPGPVKDRNIGPQADLGGVTVLKVDIVEITGKESL